MDRDTRARDAVLTINGGSSSLKFALYARGEAGERRLSGSVERIGQGQAALTVKEASGHRRESRPVEAPDHAAAAAVLIERLRGESRLDSIAAVGHRVVHGGPRYSDPLRVTPELLEELRKICPFDPDHLPAEIALIEAFSRLDPGLPQIACFDTAFHRDMPQVAQWMAIPRRYHASGVRRFGFHGLSYTFLMEELARVAGAEAASGRVILAHLGNGASLAAVRGGKSLETTMGLTPTAGLVMGTRSGDLDPGLVGFLARTEGMQPEAFNDMVNRRSGLLGVSDTSADMRDLLAREGDDPRAAEAVALFCYQARKWIGALAAVLGGLDTLVFAGGVGENSPAIRRRICEGLEFLGVWLDEGRNAGNSASISSDGASADVRVIATDEERVIARSVDRLL